MWFLHNFQCKIPFCLKVMNSCHMFDDLNVEPPETIGQEGRKQARKKIVWPNAYIDG